MDPAPAPWARFARWLPQQTWGSFVILGPRGRGKTWTALRLAEIWREAHGYDVEAVHMYGEDLALLPGARTITMAELGRRITRLRSVLEGKGRQGTSPPTSSPTRTGGEAGPAPGDADRPVTATVDQLPFLQRVLLVDEMSLTVGTHGTDAGRRIVRAAMAQSRHLQWCVVFIGQYARQLPLDLFLNQCILVKEPDGREPAFDRDDPWIQDLWAAATRGFKEVRHSAWFDEHPDPRGWAYAHAEDLGNGHGYGGMVPVRAPGGEET